MRVKYKNSKYIIIYDAYVNLINKNTDEIYKSHYNRGYR